MSHNIVLKDVKFKDLSTLARAVAAVSNGQCVLDKNATRFRTYPGQPDTCDAVIKMPGNYDIGLRKQGDAYVPIADFSMMHYSNPLRGGDNHMGLVQQEYILQEAEYQAAQNGFTSTRIKNGGRVTLELVAAD
jgi:hypothetical protein